MAAGDGTTLALGYLHRTCWEPGGTVEIDGRAATVYELPLVIRCATGLVALAVGGCSTSPTASSSIRSPGDPYPTTVDTSTGAIVLGASDAPTSRFARRCST